MRRLLRALVFWAKAHQARHGPVWWGYGAAGCFIAAGFSLGVVIGLTLCGVVFLYVEWRVSR